MECIQHRREKSLRSMDSLSTSPTNTTCPRRTLTGQHTLTRASFPRCKCRTLRWCACLAEDRRARCSSLVTKAARTFMPSKQWPSDACLRFKKCRERLPSWPCYAAWLTSERTRSWSSSGGAFMMKITYTWSWCVWRGVCIRVPSLTTFRAALGLPSWRRPSDADRAPGELEQ